MSKPDNFYKKAYYKDNKYDSRYALALQVMIQRGRESIARSDRIIKEFEEEKQ